MEATVSLPDSASSDSASSELRDERPGAAAPRHPIRRALEAGEYDDELFDELYSGRIRDASACFWTPVAVACRAATLLARLGASRVLDVGSGPGKFCIAGAAVRPKLTFTGIEQRADLVAAARTTSRRLGLDNASFELGEVTCMDWDAFDGFYFFNPFGENLHSPDEDHFDDAVELSGGRYLREIAWVEHRLATLVPGSIVATYHGFGGRVPASYDLVAEEPCGTNRLRIWVKSGAWRAGWWRELYGGGVQRGRFFDCPPGGR